MQSADARTHVDQTRTHVLVVDDDHATLDLIRSVLEANGFRCLTAVNGEEALEIIRTTPGISIAISDISMPGVDGISLWQRMKALPDDQSPRVIFLSAYTSVEYTVAALRLGAIDFLTKPVRPENLLKVVRSAIVRVQHERAVSALREQAAALAQQAEVIAATLKEWAQPQTQGFSAGTQGEIRPAQPAPDDPARVHACASALLGLDHIYRLRRAFPLLREFDDVARAVLRELLCAEKSSRRLSVSALSVSVEHVSSTTALRRIQELVRAGHLIRSPDPMDARRDFVTLAPEIRATFEQYLERVAQELAAVTASS